MSDNEVTTLLQDGIAAAKAGERAQARDLLQRVIEADESNLQAWLWLTSVVTTLEDREVCLENVLTLDPSSEAVRKDLEWVRQQIASTPEIEPESILPRVETDEQRIQEAKVSVDFSDAEFDDPLLCVYCAALTGENDRRCPNCKRTLYHSYLKRLQPAWIWVGWTAGLIDVFFSLGALVVLLFILSSALSVAKLSNQNGDVLQVLSFYFGQANSLTVSAQTIVLSVLSREQFYLRLGYVVFTLLATFGLLTRRRVYHILYIGGLALAMIMLYLNSNINHALVLPGVAATPLERILQIVSQEVLGVFVLLSSILALPLILFKTLLAFLMEGDFEVVTERLWNAIDKTVREALTAFIRAKAYMKREMWTLAALYLQRAVSLQPTAVDYQLALAESYAHLGRYQRSLHMLNQAERLQPDSAVILQLKTVILEMELQARAKAVPAQSA